MKYLIVICLIGYWYAAVQSQKAYTVNKPVSSGLVYFHNDLYPVKTYPAK